MGPGATQALADFFEAVRQSGKVDIVVEHGEDIETPSQDLLGNVTGFLDHAPKEARFISAIVSVAL
jgi:hypothetical protein